MQILVTTKTQDEYIRLVGLLYTSGFTDIKPIENKTVPTEMPSIDLDTTIDKLNFRKTEEEKAPPASSQSLGNNCHITQLDNKFYKGGSILIEELEIIWLGLRARDTIDDIATSIERNPGTVRTLHNRMRKINEGLSFKEAIGQGTIGRNEDIFLHSMEILVSNEKVRNSV